MNTTEPAISLDERLAAHLENLSPTEQRVARFFSEHREEVGFISAVEIAQQLGTSDATVVRAAQSLGYAGLPELKRELTSALRSRGTPVLRLGRSLEQVGDHPEAALDQILSLQIELLEETRRTVQPAAFARALDLLAAAERTLIFGIGPSASLASYFALRLVRFNRQASTITSTGFLLADALLGLRSGDILLIMAYGRLREVELTLDRARERGVPVILITDTLAAALAARIDVALVVCHGRSGMLSAMGATLALMDALLLGLGARDRPHALATFEELNALRARIGGHPAGAE